MRILLAGATGVLGRAVLPHLRPHEVFGLTRSAEKLQLLRHLGAEALVCDVYDYETLLDVATRTEPQTVVNFLTDLTRRSAAANSRIRREGGDNLRNAATAAGASRLVVESVAFTLEGAAGEAVDHLERAARAFAGDVLILRFGRLWGPGTFHRSAPSPPAIHVDEAGAEAARLIADATPGTYTVTG
jgi:nucleoside-diphosphate-sugar epimerase